MRWKYIYVSPNIFCLISPCYFTIFSSGKNNNNPTKKNNKKKTKTQPTKNNKKKKRPEISSLQISACLLPI